MKTSLALILSAAALISGCAKPQAPLAQSTKFEPQGSVQSEAPGTPDVPVGKATIVLNKDALSQEYLYGADLQYSSRYDKDMDLYAQSLALGHVPAKFRIWDGELQLIAENGRLFPSDVNHPDSIISRYPIISQTDTTLTVGAANSGAYLAGIFAASQGNTDGQLVDPSGAPPRDLLVRSVEFDPKGDYLLQQTTVTLTDGTNAEFMESVFPRSNLVPSADFLKFKLNADTHSNWDDGDTDLIARFRLLPAEKNFHGEDYFEMAAHPDLGAGAEMRWYVTPNIPDEALSPVKYAVEGWNRYFSRMGGFHRDVMRFMGRLPEGVHLGDPRYNVINWDSRRVAGAAYESQASDPETGKQSHSLIYMPAAWLQIGHDYWKGGEFTERSVAPGALSGGIFKSARVACMRDVRDAAATLKSGRLSEQEQKTFGVQLLKQTLFHEVGHALGLAHDFRGSLAYDPSKKNTIFSDSIMDYNDFEIERQAFDDVNGSKGPLLEYDRQALSALHDNGADVSKADPVLGACNDAEADTQTDGVDPICIRYDVQKDPTRAIDTAFARVNAASVDGDLSLAQAIGNAASMALSPDQVAAAKDKASYETLRDAASGAVASAIDFYYYTGRTGIARTVKNGEKSLLAFEKDVLPKDYDEAAMRERAINGVRKAVALTALPAASKKALAQALRDVADKLSQTPYFQGLLASERSTAAKDVAANLAKATDDAMNDPASGSIVKTRIAVISGLASQKASLFYGKLTEGRRTLREDYESAIINLLAQVAAEAKGRAPGERLAAAGALASYADRPEADTAIKRLKQTLDYQFRVAADSAGRDLATKLLGALKPKKKSPDDAG